MLSSRLCHRWSSRRRPHYLYWPSPAGEDEKSSHSWGQNLLYHRHLHCLVTGGGLWADGARWIDCRPGFFLPVRVLSRLFRRLFLESLERAVPRSVDSLPSRSADYRDRYQNLTGQSLRDCPVCGHGRRVRIRTLRPGQVHAMVCLHPPSPTHRSACARLSAQPQPLSTGPTSPGPRLHVFDPHLHCRATGLRIYGIEDCCERVPSVGDSRVKRRESSRRRKKSGDSSAETRRKIYRGFSASRRLCGSESWTIFRWFSQWDAAARPRGVGGKRYSQPALEAPNLS